MAPFSHETVRTDPYFGKNLSLLLILESVRFVDILYTKQKCCSKVSIHIYWYLPCYAKLTESTKSNVTSSVQKFAAMASGVIMCDYVFSVKLADGAGGSGLS